MDTQTTEVVGRNLLITQLVRDGLEVARPERDRGVDLIAYLDLDEAGGGLRAVPIQLKAATHRSFGIDSKYQRFAPSGMIHAFVWDIHDPDATVTYALTWAELVVIGDAMGWLDTTSWKTGNKYANTRPGAKLMGCLEPYRVRPGDWKAKVLELTTSGVGLQPASNR